MNQGEEMAKRDIYYTLVLIVIVESLTSWPKGDYIH